ncbi:Transmembrane protein 94 [Anabarilius grahami]|uniref:Transmembrane protein 94 n=1 Tax=Anabarilius grahami TaxID=495550 RepID=A0A3N0XKZ3_ANAGA|nr:Transmembrane protein 94 [Anabarilius grahami]
MEGKRCLELSQHRPVSVLDNERFTVQSLLERGPAPFVLVNGVLPLLPLTFPLLWVFVCMNGEACVLLQMGSESADWWELWKLTCKKCYSVFWGQTSTLCHTASLLHSLGSVTVLCCVDKQGILSWPSPNPEKILFFSKSASSQETERQRQKEAKKEKDKDEEEVGLKDPAQIRSLCSLEMLSLSVGQAQCDDTWVQFDDTCWQRHAPSLRPLGLAVQLVLCDPGVATRMLRLSDHLTHAALVRTRPPCQPVCPPWGLCHLPRILGFSASAKEPFEQRMSVAAYTLPSISCPGEPGIIAPPSVSMRRLPFSHLIALLVHHTQTGDPQLFSYGSADVILGACTEFWDGEDIQRLTDSDRKKVVDFYQRSCMAGQCVAVSFKPLLQPHDPEIDDTCVELPFNHNTDTTGLDSACIRFVYFSIEEEVRSKVFAEKMGLETGWNCHISLQSESFPLDPDNVDEPETEEEEEILLRDSVRERTESRAMEHDGACLIEDLNREYGEVVCCLGSSQNINNNEIFLQSDISVSLLGKPSDNSIMKVPTGKNLRFLPKKTLQLFVLCFLVKFGLTVCTFLTCFGLLLHSFCLDINHQDEDLCHPAALLMPVLNASLAMASRFLWHDPDLHHTFYISDIPMVTWMLGILWLIPLVFINEGIKLHEIRMRVRYQKRQKLQFDTKLGMNSPF